MPKFLSASDALAFLITHRPEHAEKFPFDLPLYSLYANEDFGDEGVTDVKDCLLTVKTTSVKPLKQDITVVAGKINREFTFSGEFKYQRGDYPLKDVTNRKGTLYVRGKYPDVSKNGFNVQQYPSYSASVKDGRVIINYWDDSRITGVFETDDENYVCGADGDWKKIDPNVQ